MSRKSIARSLPPISEVLSTAALTEHSNKQRVVLEELKKAAKRLRRRKSQPFYSMREIAGFYKASLRTVARAYEMLEREGLFTRLRGSQTLLTGTADSTQNLVRGIVGIPVWLHSIIVSPFTRVLWMELEECLRKEGFVADIIFFRTGEDFMPDFGERLLRHNLNYVIWHTPHPLASHVRLYLQDHGVKQLTIQMKESPMSTFPATYLLDWQPAYLAMAKAWREAGIRRVLIPNPVYLPSQQALKSFRKLLNDSGMEVQVIGGGASDLLQNVRGQGITAVAFLDQQGADTLCNKNPMVIEQISLAARLAFCRGPIRLPYLEGRSTRADIVGFSPVGMAERIAADLCNQSKVQSEKPFTFEALFHSQRMLSDIPEST